MGEEETPPSPREPQIQASPSGTSEGHAGWEDGLVPKKIFISSMKTGLEDLRQQISQGIQTMQHLPVMMETFGAGPEPPIEVCLSRVRESDIFVLIVGSRYGSLLPGSDVSFTHREFREALELDLEILAFFVSDDPPTPAEEQEKMAAFKREVGVVTWSEQPRATLAASCIASLSNRLHTVSKPRFFKDADGQFEGLLNESAVFNHRTPLIGRDLEMKVLREFLAGASRVVMLVAPGGAGKSRLLLEAARTFGSPGDEFDVRFVSGRAKWAPEHVRELGSKKPFIIFDDAHQRADIEQIVAACLSKSLESKFLFATRPLGEAQVWSQLRSVDDGHRSKSIHLELLELGRAAVALAQHVLGKEHAHLAGLLVKASDGNPLIITVGGRCLAKGELGPALLAGDSSAFRTAALDFLVEATVRDSLPTTVPFDDLMGTISAIAPFKVEDSVHVENLAKFLGAPIADVFRSLDLLGKAGLFLRRGRLVRITPDVLADHLILKLALTSGGVATGQVDRWISAFRSLYFGNLLENIGELDLKLRFAGASDNTLLAAFWKSTWDALPGLTNVQRADLLSDLMRVAIYEPQPALKTVKALIDGPAAPPDPNMKRFGVQDDPLTSLRQAPAVLRRIARHSQFTYEASLLLCRLIGIGGTRLGSPESAPQAFRTLLHYDVGYLRSLPHSVEASQALIEGIQASVEALVKTADLTWVCEAMDEALDREIVTTESSGEGMTIGAGALYPYYSKIAAVRKAAMDLLEHLILTASPANAKQAAKVLLGLLSEPHGSFARPVDDEDLKGWLPESIEVAARLGRLASVLPSLGQRFSIRSSLELHRKGSWSELNPAIVQGIAQIPSDVDDGVRAFLLRIDWHPNLTKSDLELRAKEDAAFFAEYRSRFPSESVLVTHLDEVVGDLVGFSDVTEGRLRLLLVGLTEKTAEAFGKMIRAIVAAKLRWLYPCVAQLLAELRAIDAGSFSTLLLSLIEGDDQRLRRELADSLRWFLQDGEQDDFLYQSVSKLCRDSDLHVRVLALNALYRVSKGHEEEAIAQVLATTFGSIEEADAALSVFSKRWGIDPDRLTDEQVDDLVLRLVELPKLDHPSLHIVQFLEHAAVRRTKTVIHLFVLRIRKATKVRDREGSSSFDPIPYEPRYLKVEQHIGSPEVIAEIQDAIAEMKKQHWGFSHWIPLLLRALSPQLKGIDKILEEMVAKDSKSAKLVCKVLAGQHHSIIYTHHALVSAVIRAADSQGPEVLRSVLGSLHAAAGSGSWNSSHGQAPPRWVEEKENAKKMMDLYARHEPVRHFFEVRLQAAIDAIKSSLSDDEELDF